jgi:hypothetical protein
MTWHILWPEIRTVSDETIRGWYRDAVANGEVERTELTETEEMARELSIAGVITLGRKP